MNRNSYAKIEAQRDWDRARQGAIIEELLALFTRRSKALLPFEEVRKRLRLTQKNYRGLQDISVDQIRGSVGRYQDFTQTFLPRNKTIGERWRRVSAATHARGVPPIEVYQVGEAYFVMDGNHRVSVARQNNAETIQAHVWEFSTPVGGLSADADINELIIKEEYQYFLDHTKLDTLRPEQNIVFTTPGRYRELEYQIAMYRQVLEEIDGEPVSYEEAVTGWYDMIYEPAIQLIHEREVLQHFPGRTEADLFIWVWRHHRILKKYGISSLTHAIDDVVRRERSTLFTRILEVLRSWFTHSD